MDKFFQWWADRQNKTAEEVVKEWHAFWNGFSETFCFCIPPRQPMPEVSQEEIRQEWHYYAKGRDLAVAVYVVIAVVTILAVIV